MGIRLQGWDVASSLRTGVLSHLGQAEGTRAQTLCSSQVPPSTPKPSLRAGTAGPGKASLWPWRRRASLSLGGWPHIGSRRMLI